MGVHKCSDCTHDHDCAKESELIGYDEETVTRGCRVCGVVVRLRRCRATSANVGRQCLRMAMRDREVCVAHWRVARKAAS